MILLPTGRQKCRRRASRRSLLRGPGKQSAGRSTTIGFKARRSSSNTTTLRTMGITCTRFGGISPEISDETCCASTLRPCSTESVTTEAQRHREKPQRHEDTKNAGLQLKADFLCVFVVFLCV